jgi:hypothetical protein
VLEVVGEGGRLLMWRRAGGCRIPLPAHEEFVLDGEARQVAGDYVFGARTVIVVRDNPNTRVADAPTLAVAMSNCNVGVGP